MAKVHNITYNIKPKLNPCSSCKTEDNLKLCKYCNKEFCDSCYNVLSCNNCKDNIVIIKKSNKFIRWLFKN